MARRGRLLLTLALSLGMVTGGTTPARADVTTVQLFTLKRTTNRNEVIYEARFNGTEFDRAQPIQAYWRMHEKGGKREELNGIEKKKAYGVRILGTTPDEVTFALASMPKQPIKVRRTVGTPGNAIGVVTTLEPLSRPGLKILLDEVFVEASPGPVMPIVTKIEARGVSLLTGETVSVDVMPK